MMDRWCCVTSCFFPKEANRSHCPPWFCWWAIRLIQMTSKFMVLWDALSGIALGHCPFPLCSRRGSASFASEVDQSWSRKTPPFRECRRWFWGQREQNRTVMLKNLERFQNPWQDPGSGYKIRWHRDCPIRPICCERSEGKQTENDCHNSSSSSSSISLLSTMSITPVDSKANPLNRETIPNPGFHPSPGKFGKNRSKSNWLLLLWHVSRLEPLPFLDSTIIRPEKMNKIAPSVVNADFNKSVVSTTQWPYHGSAHAN